MGWKELLKNNVGREIFLKDFFINKNNEGKTPQHGNPLEFYFLKIETKYTMIFCLICLTNPFSLNVKFNLNYFVLIYDLKFENKLIIIFVLKFILYTNY